MKTNISRRDFAWEASSGVGGLLAGTLLNGREAMGQERDPAEKRLVLLGLNALARAAELDYFVDGHHGASLVSAHLLCEENKLPEQARSRIEQLLDLNWASSPLCKPFPEVDPDPEQLKKIGEALVESGSVLREAGHNIIFAMLAI